MIPVKPRMKAPAKAHQPRVLFFNDGQHNPTFSGNYVSTTKYTIITYFPKALFEQFRWGSHPSASYGRFHCCTEDGDMHWQR